MYDLWESLLLESDIESQVIIFLHLRSITLPCLPFQSLKKVSAVMQKKISHPMRHFRLEKLSQLQINADQHRDFDEILSEGHRMIQDVQNDYSKIYDTQGVSPDYHRVHNEYVLELTGVNTLYSRYQSEILPKILQVSQWRSIE